MEGKPTKLYWKREEGQSSHFSRLEHLEQEGTIHVKQSDFYLISSMITIWLENDTVDSVLNNNEVVMRHFVKVISVEGGEKVLLENAVSKCDIAAVESQKSSMMEAVFWLEENEKLFVASSHPHKLICADQKNNFFIHVI